MKKIVGDYEHFVKVMKTNQFTYFWVFFLTCSYYIDNVDQVN